MSSNRQAGGYKAAMHNPHVTEEGKQRAAEKLEELERSRGRQEKNEANVIGGYKATLKNPNVSEEAKEHAKEVLEEHGVQVETEEGLQHVVEQVEHRRDQAGKDEAHVIAGYKAALKNANVSEEAKEHAKEVLEGHGVHVEESG